MSIAIDRDKPIPDRSGGGKAVYPFADMEIGDSFTLEPDHPGALRIGKSNTRRVVNAAHTYAKAHGKKFVSRRGNDGSITIWRTE